jgi:DNA-binding NtrC family response regulator
MKTPVVLLLTNDPILEECVAQILLESGGLSHLTHCPSDALDLVCTTGQDVDLAVIDCEHGPHGMTLVGAIHSRREGFPVIVITRDGEKYIEALAYANGAIGCLSKPVSATQLTEAIRQCRRPYDQPAITA